MVQQDASLPLPSPDWALFLDFDGTLVELAATPMAILVPPELPFMLERLRDALNGAVALISGRTLRDLDHFLGESNLAAAGQHGAEMRIRGRVTRLPGVADMVAPLLPAIEGFAGSRPGLLVENKGMSLALHYRRAPEHGDAALMFLNGLIDGDDAALELIRGHGVVEIKPRGMNKGNAVERFMDTPPFRGRVPVFIGDDTTDEDGFRAALRLGGTAIRVGLGGESVARARIADPAAARSWLADIADRFASPEARRRHAGS